MQCHTYTVSLPNSFSRGLSLPDWTQPASNLEQIRDFINGMWFKVMWPQIAFTESPQDKPITLVVLWIMYHTSYTDFLAWFCRSLGLLAFIVLIHKAAKSIIIYFKDRIKKHVSPKTGKLWLLTGNLIHSGLLPLATLKISSRYRPFGIKIKI